MSAPTAAASPASKDPKSRPLRLGDLVRVSSTGARKSKRLNERSRALGRVSCVKEGGTFDIEWILEGGRNYQVEREDLLWTTAEAEGMTNSNSTRKRRKPSEYQMEVELKDKAKKVKKQQGTKRAPSSLPAKKVKRNAKKSVVRPPSGQETTIATVDRTAHNSSSAGGKKLPPAPKPKKRKVVPQSESVVSEPTPTEAVSQDVLIYDKHKRELERFLKRLHQKIDVFQHFGADDDGGSDSQTPKAIEHTASNLPTATLAPPKNWETIRLRMNQGCYVVDRKQQDQENRYRFFGELGEQPNVVGLACPIGVDWERFRQDVFAMLDAAQVESERQRDEQKDDDPDEGQRGSLSYASKKIKEALEQTVERTGPRHAREMILTDDRLRFGDAIQRGTNAEAAMQSWRKDPFPERKYERLSADTICAGLSAVDKKIAEFERRTLLPDSFIGLSYRYDDTHQSETWMQSVVDETGGGGVSKRKADNERQAALALSADEGVRKAQVNATMQRLLIAVQDKVMTYANVLQQPELKSANWLSEESDSASAVAQPEIVEQPVWGIDCYTRKNIMLCLQVELSPANVLLFIEKWLLPAINACPEPLAHKIINAARTLEGLPLLKDEEQTNFSPTVLGTALNEKICCLSPQWIKGAANLLRRAVEALGVDFFRVHPKGHGSVVLCNKLPPNTLVTYYRGELYPSWRWGEKMDAIEITQKRTNLKPALPDFYNMVLERPQTDPRGYGLLFIDASRKAGHGSSLSHSCAPTCEVRVAARDGGLCLAMTTLRELEIGEELTFDYNAVTESLNEYRSAVCLCGKGKCRGSFLHFSTADCYQQVLNRNSPVAARFASLVKSSMKQVMSPEDEKILQTHGFNTAAFGAISVIRREADSGTEKPTLSDSIEMVPIWLKTYVAEVLRYIEYERRALPIALICDHLASSKEGDEAQEDDTSVVKEPKREPSFFFFSRTQSSLLSKTLLEQGCPTSLKGLQRKHAMQKVASAYWANLPEEKKLHWKNESEKDYEKKLRTYRSGVAKPTTVNAKPKKTKQKPSIEEIMVASKMSFQDADGEGVSAMEQRIQQLTQSLSRVGRVLDRHRESCFDKENREETAQGSEMVHAPLRFLSDNEVVDWLWKDGGGLVLSLITAVDASRCARPQLTANLRQIRDEFLAPVNLTGSVSSVEQGEKSSRPIVTYRESRLGLMRLREAILVELKSMATDIRKARNAAKSPIIPESQATSAAPSDDDAELSPHAASPGASVAFGPSLCPHKSEYPTQETIAIETEREDRDMQWIEHYGERCALQAAADVILFYAHTSTFFLLQPYTVLQSTPIEVYARELGNTVPKSAIDNRMEETPLAINPSSSSSEEPNKLCAPDDIIADVTVRYQGEFVLSQLLQWYNAGIGQEPGLPDLLGCSLLPRIPDCWSSEQFRKTTTKSERKTVYETKVRRKLVEWMQDPFQRGSSWPTEIVKAFAGEEIMLIGKNPGELFVPFGSPIVDFLVTGDESNITNILSILDRDNKIKQSEKSDGLLSSVDKGRPAQAVSTWVQCENPECQKWRKIPWYVDADALPEHFYCTNNIWNESANFCGAPEDDWDSTDALVGTDGKVEGSPVKKKKNEESLDVAKEESFAIGARFDVRRSDQEKYTVATVVKVDFSGSSKRVFFHFLRSVSDRDEWVPLGSDRIASLHSRSSKSVPKAKGKQAPRKKGGQYRSELSVDPSILSHFVVGARFDVLRKAKERYYPAIVQSVETSESATRILFRFMRTSSDSDEWVEFGSPRILKYKTKSQERLEKRKEKHIKNSTSTEKRLSVVALEISKTVLNETSLQSVPTKPSNGFGVDGGSRDNAANFTELHNVTDAPTSSESKGRTSESTAPNMPCALRSGIQSNACENNVESSPNDIPMGYSVNDSEEQTHLPRLDKESAVISGSISCFVGLDSELCRGTIHRLQSAPANVSELAHDRQAQRKRSGLEMAKEDCRSATNSRQPPEIFSHSTTNQGQEISRSVANVEFQNVLQQQTSAFDDSGAVNQEQPVPAVAQSVQGEIPCSQEPFDAQSLSHPIALEQRYSFVPPDPVSTLQMASGMTNEQLTNALSRELEQQARAASGKGPIRANMASLGVQYSRNGDPMTLHPSGIQQQQQQHTTTFAPGNALERMVRQGQAIPPPISHTQCSNRHLGFGPSQQYENQVQQSQLAASSYQPPPFYANSHHQQTIRQSSDDFVTPSLSYQDQSSTDSILRQQVLQNINVGDSRFVDERFSGRTAVSAADQARLLLSRHQQREWDQQQSAAIALGRQEQQLRQQQLHLVHRQQQLPHNPHLAPMSLPTLAHGNQQPLSTAPQSPLDILAAVSQMQLDSQQR